MLIILIRSYSILLFLFHFSLINVQVINDIRTSKYFDPEFFYLNKD